MKRIDRYGNYSIIMYDENFITIDFSDENVGMTVQTFDNLEAAEKAFEIVKTLPQHKAQYHNTDVVKRVIALQG